MAALSFFTFALTGDIILLIIILIVAVLIIAVLRALFILLPAVIVAAVIWFLTHNLSLTALAFLVIAILSFLKRH